MGPGGRGGPGGRAAPQGGVALFAVERAVNDLKLSEKSKEAAAAAIKAQKEEARKLTELARAELLLQMGDVLSEEQMKEFKAAVDRQPGVGDRPPGGRNGPPPGPPRP